MKNILVGFSYSKPAPSTIFYAFKLAQYFEATVTIAHLFANQEVSNLSEAAVNKKMIEKKRELSDFINQIKTKQYHSVEVITLVEYGLPSEKLAQIAKSIQADLVVLGVSRRVITDKLLFVNRPMEFAEKVDCPVLTIPVDGGFKGINRIVYASDFTLEDVAALWELENWTKIFHAKLLCVHICKTKEEKKRAERRMQILQKLFPDKNFEFLIETGNVSELLQNVLEINQADIIAVLKRRKTLWQSIIRPNVIGNLANASWIPLFIFKQS